MRLVVNEADSETPVTSGSVLIELLSREKAPAQKAQLLYRGPVNPRGTTGRSFAFQPDLAGNYMLHYAVELRSGRLSRRRRFGWKRNPLFWSLRKSRLSARADDTCAWLALDRASHQAVYNRKLTFEAEDSRGNKDVPRDYADRCVRRGFRRIQSRR